MGGVADAAWANFTNNVYGSIVALRGTPNGVSSNSRMAIFDAPRDGCGAVSSSNGRAQC